MGRLLRWILSGLAAAFIAMFAEPFFSELLRQAGIDTSAWAGLVLMALAALMSIEWFRLLAVGVIGAAVGAWLHWAASRIDDKKKSSRGEIDSAPRSIHDVVDLGSKLMRYAKDLERMIREEPSAITDAVKGAIIAVNESLRNHGIKSPDMSEESTIADVFFWSWYARYVGALLFDGHKKAAKRKAIELLNKRSSIIQSTGMYYQEPET